MPSNSGLLNDYWRMWRQKRMATGIGPSYNDTMGAVDAGLQNEARLAQIASNRALEQERIDMAKDQIAKQNRAATWSGIGQGVQLGGNLYLGKGLLDLYKSKVPPVSPGAANGGIVTGGSGLPVQSGPVNAPIPYGTTPITGNVGEGLGVSASTPAAMTPLAAAGNAAALYGAQMVTSDLLEKPMNELGLHHTNKAFKYAGMPGALAVAPFEVGANFGKKVLDAGKDLLDHFGL